MYRDKEAVSHYVAGGGELGGPSLLQLFKTRAKTVHSCFLTVAERPASQNKKLVIVIVLEEFNERHSNDQLKAVSFCEMHVRLLLVL